MRNTPRATLSQESTELRDLILTQDYVGAYNALTALKVNADAVFEAAHKKIAEVKPEFDTLLHLYIKHYAKSPLGKGETNTEGADKQQFFEEHMLKNMTLEMLEEKIQMAKPRHP